MLSFIHSEVSDEFVFRVSDIFIVGVLSYLVNRKIPIKAPNIVGVGFFHIVFTTGLFDSVDVDAFEKIHWQEFRISSVLYLPSDSTLFEFSV